MRAQRLHSHGEHIVPHTCCLRRYAGIGGVSDTVAVRTLSPSRALLQTSLVARSTVRVDIRRRRRRRCRQYMKSIDLEMEWALRPLNSVPAEVLAPDPQRSRFASAREVQAEADNSSFMEGLGRLSPPPSPTPVTDYTADMDGAPDEAALVS